jgi:hypothetical protein
MLKMIQKGKFQICWVKENGLVWFHQQNLKVLCKIPEERDKFENTEGRKAVEFTRTHSLPAANSRMNIK